MLIVDEKEERRRRKEGGDRVRPTSEGKIRKQDIAGHSRTQQNAVGELITIK